MHIKRLIWMFVALMWVASASFNASAQGEENKCIACHRNVTPGQVADWESSKMAKMGLTCSVCHEEEHKTAKDSRLAHLPDEHVCGECHEDHFDQFVKGKHNFGWTSLNALPITHMEPDEMMEGGKGCGGCHNMGVKSEARKRNCGIKATATRTIPVTNVILVTPFPKRRPSTPRPASSVIWAMIIPSTKCGAAPNMVPVIL